MRAIISVNACCKISSSNANRPLIMISKRKMKDLRLRLVYNDRRRLIAANTIRTRTFRVASCCLVRGVISCNHVIAFQDIYRISVVIYSIMAISNKTKQILDEYPFLSLISFGKQEYLGIVQNQDSTSISMYVYDYIRPLENRALFLQLGSQWWWETNRMISINIILGHKFKPFSECLRTFSLKEAEIQYGPTVCLNNIIKKRIKRKNVRLVRRIE